MLSWYASNIIVSMFMQDLWNHWLQLWHAMEGLYDHCFMTFSKRKFNIGNKSRSFLMYHSRTLWKHRKTVRFSDVFRGYERVHWQWMDESSVILQRIFLAIEPCFYIQGISQSNTSRWILLLCNDIAQAQSRMVNFKTIMAWDLLQTKKIKSKLSNTW